MNRAEALALMASVMADIVRLYEATDAVPDAASDHLVTAHDAIAVAINVCRDRHPRCVIIEVTLAYKEQA